MIKLIKKLRAKWILYRLRHCKRYKRTIKVTTTKDEVRQAFTSPEALDEYIAKIMGRQYAAINEDYVRLRLDAGEIVTDCDGIENKIWDKYNI